MSAASLRNEPILRRAADEMGVQVRWLEGMLCLIPNEEQVGKRPKEADVAQFAHDFFAAAPDVLDPEDYVVWEALAEQGQLALTVKKLGDGTLVLAYTED